MNAVLVVAAGFLVALGLASWGRGPTTGSRRPSTVGLLGWFGPR